MAKKKKVTFEEVAEEVLKNARDDRQMALNQIEKLKDVFNIDTKNSESMSAAMLIGGSLVKLIEQLTRSNEQLVRVAQIKEREESKQAVAEKGPIDLESLLKNHSTGDEEDEPS